MSFFCPDCGMIHGGPRCLPPQPPTCSGSYTAEYEVTLEDVKARPRVWWEPHYVNGQWMK